MEATTFGEVAALVLRIGALGILVAVLNAVALRLVRIDEVPCCARSRIRWWGAHNPALFVVSVVLTVAGVAGLLAA
ncbi:hypothetical protein Ade02nite_60450 [Paractinoplanes deccanensis]|uniref:Uncharacterized protein n=1 Tax=Paractinoplanes deccanensis TaxID=113561 RepID=A0ABQ3YBM5_9ACTN|nr:hypothetical protein [Actinoplanes deccanensis]GID77404.1 hypothetical protein Ade02nite_60450 [Actinoplanes deccanensis]